ncbi:MAG: hypothetical protein LBD97_06720 [Bifidobacteriaceae bacterium]|jgi:hypothetical protein|nr:hypothetical protein [Bifidobacteriaceae bacterium]
MGPRRPAAWPVARAFVLTVGLAGGFGWAGCSAGTPPAATPSGAASDSPASGAQPSGSETSGSQRDTAVAFQECLLENEISAALWDIDDSTALVALIVSQAVAWNPIDGVWNSFLEADGSDMDAVSKAFFEDISQNEPTSPKLMIQGIDRSAEYAECFVMSGYFEPAEVSDPTLELEEKTAAAEASNNWAACARAAGYPQIKDTDPPVADDYATRPEIVIPLTVTPDELRALIAECPFAGVAFGDEGLVYPNIVVAEPTPGPLFEADSARSLELAEVLGG